MAKKISAAPLSGGFAVEGWMRSSLRLKGNALLVYALVFSATGPEKGHGLSVPSISEWTGLTIRQARNICDELAGKGLFSRIQTEEMKQCRFVAISELSTSYPHSDRLCKSLNINDLRSYPQSYPHFAPDFGPDFQQKIDKRGKIFPVCKLFPPSQTPSFQRLAELSTELSTPKEKEKKEPKKRIEKERDPRACAHMGARGAPEGNCDHPASPEEVADFFGSEKIGGDPRRFWERYSSCGWRINGEPIRSWRALAREWAEKPHASARPAVRFLSQTECEALGWRIDYASGNIADRKGFPVPNARWNGTV